MGKIITLSPKEIFPTQTSLSGPTVAEKVKSYLEEVCVPFPVVRYFSGRYVTIDGHHRIAANDLLDRDVKVYKPDNSGDRMTTEDFPEYSQDFCNQTNLLISQRYSGKGGGCNLLRSVRNVRSARIFSFTDLRSSQEGGQLKSKEALFEYYPEYFR